MAITTKIFIDKSLKIHNFKYSYESVSYIDAKTKVSINCPIHGYFLQTPSNHTHVKYPQGCPKCCKTLKSSTENFIIKAKLIHNDVYNYESVNYNKADLPITIICKKHGEFEQLPKHHLSGHGCTKCNITGGIGFTKEAFVKKFSHKQCNCYIIQCYNDTESFIKIGITGQSIQKRFSDKNALPYQYTIVTIYKGNAAYIFNLEKNLHEKFKQFQYKPTRKFCGSTECYKITQDILLTIV